MTEIWIAIGAAAVISALLKGAGPLVIGRRDLPPAATGVIAMMGPVLLAALVTVDTFADGEELVLDARAGGVGVAAVALLGRAPMVVALVLAAATTALLRAV